MGTLVTCSRVVWLGDLNYRIDMSHSATQSLIKKREWETLLNHDQVRFISFVHA